MTRVIAYETAVEIDLHITTEKLGVNVCADDKGQHFVGCEVATTLHFSFIC